MGNGGKYADGGLLSRVQRRREPRGQACLYARVLDGKALWLAVPAPSGSEPSLTLKDNASGRVVPLVHEVEKVGDQTVLSARVELIGDAAPFVPAAGASWRVVLRDTGPEGERRKTKVAPPAALDSPGPTRTPTSPDGRWRFRLVERRGSLSVVCDHLPLSAFVADVSVAADGFRIVFTTPDVIDGAVGLAVFDHERGETWRAEAVATEPRRYIATLPVLDMPLEAGTASRLEVVVGREARPLLRSANDLKRPMQAVQLPYLEIDRADGSLSRFRLGYARQGDLTVTRIGSGRGPA